MAGNQNSIHDSIFWVEVDRIRPNPFQPRREFDQARLQELAESIRMYGLLQPLTVTRQEIPLEDGSIRVEYELIAGERRLRASKLAGIKQLPVIIRTGEESDQIKFELAIIENLQREDLNPIERAIAFQRLVKEFGHKHGEVGRRIGKSREYVSNTIRLLSLPEHIQQHIAERKLSEGHTRPVMMLNDRPEEQEVLVKEIVLKKLTVREAEAIARKIAQEKVRNKSTIHPELIEMEQKLTERLGTRVYIEPRSVGGRVVISYFSPEDLDALLQSIAIERAAAKAAPVSAPAPEVASMPNVIVVGDTTNIADLVEQVAEQVDEATAEGSVEEGSVTMAEDRPFPEPEEDNPDLLDDRSIDEVNRDESDDDLYSIRNFSV
jgi:ParB family chromosome partitioning protein